MSKTKKRQWKLAKPVAAGESNQLSRRNFLQLALGALSTLAVVEMGAAGLLYLRARSLEGKYGGIVTAGAIEDFPPGSVTEFEESHFYLVCTEDGGFLAVYRRCPHLGCTVNWVAENEKFYCPCHASSFSTYGDYQNQPVTRALDTFEVLFEGGVVKVDTSRLQMRAHYTPEQIRYRN